MDGEFPLTSSGFGILDLQRPAVQRLPLVLASPHSGAEYPADFLAASQLDPLALRRSEDRFVGELFSGAAQAGGAPFAGPLSPGFGAVNTAGFSTRARHVW